MTARSDQLSRRRLCQASLIGGGLLFAGTAPAAATDDASTRWLSWSTTGYVANGVDFGDDTPEAVEQRVGEQLPDADLEAIIAHQQSDEVATVEVLDAAVSEAAFRSAMDANGYSYGSVTAGSTQQTRETIIEVLGARLGEVGIDATIYEATTESEQYTVVELSESDESTARELLGSRGAVSIDIYYEDGGEYRTETGLTSDDFSSVGSATQDDRSGPHVPVTVDVSAAEVFQQRLVETGVAQPGGSRCTYEQDPDSTESCLLVVEDDTVRNSFGMAPGLADSMRDGSWAENSGFILTTSSLEAAQQLSVFLRSGPLPVELSITASDEPPVDESELDERTAVSPNEGKANGETDISAPGFGFGAAVAALGGAGYLFGQNSVETDHE